MWCGALALQRDEKEDEAIKLRNRHTKRRMLLLLHSTAKEMALMRRKDYIAGRHPLLHTHTHDHPLLRSQAFPKHVSSRSVQKPFTVTALRRRHRAAGRGCAADCCGSCSFSAKQLQRRFMRLWLSYTICQRHIGQTEYRRFQQSKRRTFRAWCAGAIMKLCLQKHNLHARSHGRPAGPGRAGPHGKWNGSRQLRRPFHNTPPVAR